MAADKIPFGMADITVGSGASQVKFDGKSFLQADGGEITIKPNFQDVKVADFGEGAWDKRIVGYDVTLKVTAADANDLKVMALALDASAQVTDVGTGAVTGISDAKIGTSLRAKGRTITIHPREMGADKGLDITLYKAASTGDLGRTYKNEAGKFEITFTALPRDGFDPSLDSNYFYIGATDPRPIV